MIKIISLLFIVIFFSMDKLISEEMDSLLIKSDSLDLTVSRDTVPEVSDSSYHNVLPKEMETEKSRKIEIVRRNFSYRTQIGTALFMMGLVVIILTSVDNLNPN